MVGRPVKIDIVDVGQVSGILLMPEHAFACLVLAHGAGAGMQHPFMAAVADGLRTRGLGTLRYQFPYMERGSKRCDAPPLAHAAVRAAVAAAAKLATGVPLLAGGKSFGGRITSQAQAERPLPDVAGLALLGFPLHPAGKPATGRAQHLAAISIPMLFLQGTRDALAALGELEPLCGALGPRATLRLFENADHSFHVPARSGRNNREAMNEILDTFADWAGAIEA